jgi:RHS repeat-associated protein
LATFAYGYDNASQLTSYTGPEGSLTYTYDNAGELTGVGGARSESFGYDLNGNRNTTGYTTAAGNELTGDGTFTYAYDAEGNQVSKTRLSDNEQWTFTWDYRNRMTQAVEKTSAGVTVTNDVFAYDVEDRRIGKSTNGTQVWYGYSDVVAPTGSGEAQSNSYIDFNGSGSVTMRYFQRLGLDSMLGRFDGTNTGWYLTDNIGSIRLIVNPSGTVLDQITYYAFGGIQNETNSSNGDRFKFTAREWDSEINQQYSRARYYNPATGRWDSRDPLNFKAGDANLYRYVAGSPLLSVDPLGLWRAKIGADVGVIVGMHVEISIGTGGLGFGVGFGFVVGWLPWSIQLSFSPGTIKPAPAVVLFIDLDLLLAASAQIPIWPAPGGPWPGGIPPGSIGYVGAGGPPSFSATVGIAF